MKVRNTILTASLALASFTGGFLVAQNVNPHRHPNLAAAQRLVDQAIARIAAAQQANEFDLGGHAARARELLGQANEQLKAAAVVSNEHQR